MNEMSEQARNFGAATVVSGWIPVTQEMIDHFGIATLDRDPMHMDPQWAERNSPFKRTISYGFLTVSLLTRLFHDACAGHEKAFPVRRGQIPLNYGLDKLRLVVPVPVGSRVRGRFSVISNSEQTRSGHPVTRLACRIEIEGQESPALVGEWLSAAVPAPQSAAGE